MTKLPSRYRWLSDEPAPRILRCALELFGTKEGAGRADNPIIMNWADEIDVDAIYGADSVPWCGLFMGVVVKRAGWDVVPNPLWARAWVLFGRAQAVAELGDILVFSRPGGGGHVGVYVGEDDRFYHVLGGNQSDAVTIARIAKSRCIAIREPIWRIAKPPNIRRVFMTGEGPVSTNEA